MKVATTADFRTYAKQCTQVQTNACCQVTAEVTVHVGVLKKSSCCGLENVSARNSARFPCDSTDRHMHRLRMQITPKFGAREKGMHSLCMQTSVKFPFGAREERTQCLWMHDCVKFPNSAKEKRTFWQGCGVGRIFNLRSRSRRNF